MDYDVLYNIYESINRDYSEFSEMAELCSNETTYSEPKDEYNFR